MFCVEAKDEDKKEASTASATSSNSVLNLAAIGPHAREKRQHNGVSVIFCFEGCCYVKKTNHEFRGSTEGADRQTGRILEACCTFLRDVARVES